MIRRSPLVACAVAVALLVAVPASGMIIITPHDGQTFPRHTVQLVRQTVDVRLTDRAAEVSVECVYHNSSDRDLEGEWIFPLPPEAAVDKFSMFVGGEEIKAELLDAAAARGIYESIVRRTQDPALLEYVDRQLLRARIFPIEARKDAAVKLYYTHPLVADFGVTDFVFPVLNETWSPRIAAEDNLRAENRLQIEINTVGTLKSVTVPTHEVGIRHSDPHHAVVEGDLEDLREAGDFHLLCAYDSREIAAQFLTTENDDGRFFMGIIAPGNAEGLATLPKDVVFCFDRSGSMQGEKIVQARNALRFCLESLNPDDRFALVWFNDGVDAFADHLVRADGPDRAAALDRLAGLTADGGTFIDGALARAQAIFENNDRPKYLVFLTDGLPTVGQRNADLITRAARERNNLRARIFTFGVGYDLNAGLLNDLAEQNHGFSSYVAPEEDVEIAVSNFFRKMSRPVLSDCRLEFAPGVIINDMYPATLPDVFAGSEIVVYGRFLNDAETTVRLHGTRGGKDVNHTFPAVFKPKRDQYPFIAKLWAGRRIGHLLDAMRVSGESPEVKDEVVRLSKTYGIMTPYTSFLAAPEEVKVAMDMATPQRAFESRGMVAGAPQVLSAIEASKLKKSNLDPHIAVPRQADQLGSPAAKQEKAVSGRRFTLIDGVWTDWNATTPNPAITDTIVVKPYSPAYFRLSQNKEIAAILALGSKVKFLWNNMLIKTDENGATEWNNNWPQL
jgi:Ca-activated chloride channel family protein